jgi:NADPH:quinone reductase-like Zn-dependent oxidoreductase
MLVSKEHQADLEALNQFIEAGQVTPVIDKTHTLAEAPDAMRLLEAGHASGKVAITI